MLTGKLPALARLHLDAASLAREFPQLRHVNIVGDTANPEEPGHDLTYQARAGLVQNGMPPTLLADMAGAERAHECVLNKLLDFFPLPGARREARQRSRMALHELRRRP